MLIDLCKIKYVVTVRFPQLFANCSSQFLFVINNELGVSRNTRLLGAIVHIAEIEDVSPCMDNIIAALRCL